jgi:hypothetical protein
MANNKMFSIETPYVTGLSRRQTLKWLGALSATTAFPLLSACVHKEELSEVSAVHWPTLSLPSITAPGYGKDPNLIMPPQTPWPLTLTGAELTLVALLADIIVPRDGAVPSASEVKVPDVINEWVSSPYSGQQQDRIKVMSLLSWLNTEGQYRAQKSFIELTATQQMAIIDDIAFRKAYSSTAFGKPAMAFAALRRLVLAAFFCSSPGSKDLGYQGNVAISGDYPGPSKEARAHLDSLLVQLGLSL